MNNKKKFIAVAIVLIGGLSVILMYLNKPLTMNDIYDKPNFSGIVREVRDTGILVEVNQDDDAYRSSDKIDVSLNTKLKDSMKNFEVGQEVRVYFDGRILETYPAEVNNVYAIVLINR